jgi:dihydroorotase
VLTHCFRPFPNTPATADGRVEPFVLEARERGIIFDIGHGMGSFAFRVGRTMLAQNFMPDCISSDVHSLSIEGPAFDLLRSRSVARPRCSTPERGCLSPAERPRR